MTLLPASVSRLDDGVFLLERYADTPSLRRELDGIWARSPLRRMSVPGGKRMSVAMSNCGALGWVSDAGGYRYAAIDPLTAAAWPPMPEAFRRLAAEAAAAAGFDGFAPDACLVNCYQDDAKLSLHQDRDERDFTQPIVSVSIGADALFQFGGLHRSDPKRSLLLHDGDVLVWGGVARLRYHAVGPARPGAGGAPAQRINLTFRKAG